MSFNQKLGTCFSQITGFSQQTLGFLANWDAERAELASGTEHKCHIVMVLPKKHKKIWPSSCRKQNQLSLAVTNTYPTWTQFNINDRLWGNSPEGVEVVTSVSKLLYHIMASPKEYCTWSIATNKKTYSNISLGFLFRCENIWSKLAYFAIPFFALAYTSWKTLQETDFALIWYCVGQHNQVYSLCTQLRRPHQKYDPFWGKRWDAWT